MKIQAINDSELTLLSGMRYALCKQKLHFLIADKIIQLKAKFIEEFRVSRIEHEVDNTTNNKERELRTKNMNNS